MLVIQAAFIVFALFLFFLALIASSTVLLILAGLGILFWLFVSLDQFIAGD